MRAALLATAKDPNPTREIFSPFLSAPSVAPINPSKALLASAFDSPDFDEMASINSDLFIVNLFFGSTIFS